MWLDVFALSTRGKILNVKASFVVYVNVMLSIQMWQIINLIRARAGKDTLVYCCRAKLCSRFLGTTEGNLGYYCRPSARHSKMKFSYSKKADFQRSVRHFIKGLSCVLCHCRFQFP